MLSMCLLWICQSAWDPYSGVRVGEASNPGPAEETDLREALLTVLKSFAPAVAPKAERRVTFADHTAESPATTASPKGQGLRGETGREDEY